jgi:maltose/maltodextrin transport system substrate-binding protein
MPSTRHWQESELPDMSYPFNSYVCKIVGATVRIECLVAREIPELHDEAMKAALGAGRYMASLAQPEGSPLAGWPPTYGEAPEDGDTYVSKVQAGNGAKMMVLEASVAGEAFLDLFDATGDFLWLERSLAVARTYARIQYEDGSWPIRVNLATGESLSHFRLWPAHALKYLRRFESQYGIKEFEQTRLKAEKYITEVALPRFDLSGMFEDSMWDDFPSYMNLTNFTASPYAAYLLTAEKPSKLDVSNAYDLIRLSEDQFVHWDKFEGVNAFPPYVCEQYFYEEPIDSSIADVCDGYLSLYEYNGDKLALAKAKALLNSLTRFQEPSGRILTLMVDFGDQEPGIEELWLNSTWWTASQLLRLDKLIR